MTYVEQGAEFTHEYGDIDKRFYNSVASALNELAALLYNEARGMYPELSERPARVEQMTDGIGWGFHDYITEVVAQGFEGDRRGSMSHGGSCWRTSSAMSD